MGLRQPDFSEYRLRFESEVPLDRRFAEPDEEAFERHDVQLLRFDEQRSDFATVATAVFYRVRADSGSDLWDAADAECESALLEDVCTRATDDDGDLLPELEGAFEGILGAGILVLDLIEFKDAADDVPVLRGMLARAVVEALGRVGEVLFLPADDADLWARAVGAVRVGEFVLASTDLLMPDFPLSVSGG